MRLGTEALTGAALVCCAAFGAVAQESRAWDGVKPGVTIWRLPDTPTGLEPVQNWYSVGSAPDGSIYVTGCDHRTNSALYRLWPGTGTLVYVGDAQSAAAAAGTLAPGETFEKFHVRPTWLDGKIYLASMDYSTYDAGYLRKPGFHWFEYDPDANTFTDVTDVVGAGKHLQVEFLIADPQRHLLYASAVPTGQLLRFDPATRTTTDLGTPPGLPVNYPETGGFMWVGADGKVYFSMKGPGSYFDHIRYWDPVTQHFGEKREWKIGDRALLKTGQWSADRRRCYMTDFDGTIYRYTDHGPAFERLGKVDHPTHTFKTRTFFLSPDESYIYLINDHWGHDPDYYIFEFDIQARTDRPLVELTDLDPVFDSDHWRYHGGHDAWDSSGAFYFATFGMSDEQRNVLLTGFNPYRFKGLDAPVGVEQRKPSAPAPTASPRRYLGLYRYRPRDATHFLVNGQRARRRRREQPTGHLYIRTP